MPDIAEHPPLGASETAARGPGLFIGVEPRTSSGHPDGSAAERIVDVMRDCGVLIGRTGHTGNALKIRPPLVSDTEHVDVLVKTLSEALEGS